MFNKYEKRIKRLQRHHQIKNNRKNYMIGIANKIVKENDIIVTEKLDVKKMSQNHRLAKYILDASFTYLISLLKWKAKEKGKYFYQVDTYYASSQRCNVCGNKNQEIKKLSVREWECKKCGFKHDRDINASINIMYEGF